MIMKDFETMKPNPEETGGIDGGKWTPKKKKNKTPYIIGVVILIIITLILILSK